jgi:hypothetical protein
MKLALAILALALLAGPMGDPQLCYTSLTLTPAASCIVTLPYTLLLTNRGSGLVALQ